MKYLALKTPSEQSISYQQLIKEENLKRIFDLIRSGRCSSRAELSRTMHLSATAISTLVEELQAEGLIGESGFEMTKTPGRRAMRLCLNPYSRQMAVFSLSSRGVSFTLYDLACRVIEKLFVAHPVGISSKTDDVDFASLFEDILMRRSRRFDRKNAIVIGVTFPGIYSEEEQAFSVRTAMNVSFSETSMRDFERRMGIPLLLANASMCMAYAEKKHQDAISGGDAEIQDMLFINICDGVGAGIISDGDVLTGPYSTAGELGHIPVVPDGEPCRCGNRGCLEQYANTRGILKAVQRACKTAGEAPPLCFEDLWGMYETSVAARTALDEVAAKLSTGILSLVCITGIRRIIVGGAARLGQGFLEQIRTQVCRCLPLTKHLYIQYAGVSADGDSAGLAHYFLDKGYVISIHKE